MRRLPAVALLLVFAAAAVLAVRSARPAQRTVIASFTDVRGLVVGGQVRLGGVPVGSVGRITLGRDGWPRVTLRIDRDVPLFASATAQVRLASLSGEFNRYVSITEGDGPPLSDGAVLGRAHTASPVEFDDALRTFDPRTRAALRQILSGLRVALSGQGPALAATLAQSQTTLADVAGLATDVGADGSALRQLVSSTSTIVGALERNASALGGALTDNAALLRTLAEHAGTLTATLSALPPGVLEAQRTLDGAHAIAQPLDRIVVEARPAVARLPAASAELRDALVTGAPVIDEAATVARDAPAAATSMLPLIQASGPLLRLMTPVLRRVGPMLDQLRVRLPDAFSFFANWADFTSNYDANGHAARVGIVLPPAPTNVLSPDSNAGGQLAPPYLRTPGSLEGQPWTDFWRSFVAGGKR